ncbi:hypothetical protein HDV05_007340 [Chytridiales sp. JEL 0842]|nr:hypothetical protein HDV05_007340 [Chytridiales sp. JEL 0842]
MRNILTTTTVADIIKSKSPMSPRHVVDVHADTLLMDATLVMKRNKVTALAVYGSTAHWIGAGEVNASTSTGKQYIGLITILDFILYLSRHSRTSNLDTLFHTTKIKNLVGSDGEGQSLWVMRPEQPLLFCLEPLGKGVHRFLVPMDSKKEQQDVDPANLKEKEKVGGDLGQKRKKKGYGKPEYFTMLTQSDVVRFLHAKLADGKVSVEETSHAARVLKSGLNVGDVERLLRSRHLKPEIPKAVELPVVAQNQEHQVRSFCWTLKPTEKVLPALTTMAIQGIPAVPIVDETTGELVETLSVSDFKSFLEGPSELFIKRREGLGKADSKMGGVVVEERLESEWEGGDEEKMAEIEDDDDTPVSEQVENEHGPTSPMRMLPSLVEGLENISVFEFLQLVKRTKCGSDRSGHVCTMSTPFLQAMDVMVKNRVHRLWVVESEEKKVPMGVLSLGDVISTVLYVARGAE